MAHFSTHAVHAGRSDLNALGVHALPLDLSTTNPLTDLDSAVASFDELVAGNPPPVGMSHIYRRAWNPTVARFEEAMATLESTQLAARGEDISDVAAIAFASGMAAITSVLSSQILGGKLHVIAVRPLYGTTDHIINTGILGNTVTWVNPADIKAAITPETGLVYIESPANPTIELVDIRDVVLSAGDVPVLVDNTFATPVLQQPLALGASFVVHSATKYIGGHGDAMGGVVITRGESVNAVRQIRLGMGNQLDPFQAYLMHRGLATLSVRVRAAQDTAMQLADWLNQQPEVSQVFYPTMPGADPLGLVGSQMAGPGAMLSFDMAGGYEAAHQVAKAVRLITHAVSLGGVDTLIEHPASLTHRVVEEEARTHPAVLRISVGLEHVDDLIADLAQAFSGL